MGKRKFFPRIVLFTAVLGVIVLFSVRNGLRPSLPWEAVWLRTHLVSFDYGGVERSYLLHVPSLYDGKKAFPLVIVLHGGGETAQFMMKETGWAEKADRENFFVVFPEGTSSYPLKPPGLRENQQVWDDGSGRFHHRAQGVDDIGFIAALIDRMLAQFAIDEQRIFITGFSNGASMAFRLGLELSDTVAAIAPVAGILSSEDSRMELPVSLFYISGAEDRGPFMGQGEFPESVKSESPVRDSIARWASMLDCPSEQRIISVFGGVRKVAQGPCRGNSEIVIYSVEGLGHIWPGGRTAENQQKGKDRFNATEAIWDFFKEHPKNF